MSNLYKVLFSHTAPKDQRVGIDSYVVAENAEQVYSIIDEKYNHGSWKDREEENEQFDIEDEDWNIIGSESFKEKIVRIEGQMNDEDYDYSDAYYGITLYGWEFVKEITEDEEKALISVGIIK